MQYNRNAFTLIEVLITLAISSMILLIGTVSMKLMLTSLAKNSSTLPSKALAFTQIRSVITSTYPYVTYSKKPFDPSHYDYRFFYDGDGKSVRFISTSPLHSTKTCIVEFILSDHQLIYKESPLYSSGSNYLIPMLSSNPYILVLIDKINNAELRYEINGSSISKISGQLPNRLKLSFESEEKGNEYIFGIQTDLTQNVSNIRKYFESI